MGGRFSDKDCTPSAAPHEGSQCSGKEFHCIEGHAAGTITGGAPHKLTGEGEGARGGAIGPYYLGGDSRLPI